MITLFLALVSLCIEHKEYADNLKQEKEYQEEFMNNDSTYVEIDSLFITYN